MSFVLLKRRLRMVLGSSLRNCDFLLSHRSLSRNWSWVTWKAFESFLEDQELHVFAVLVNKYNIVLGKDIKAHLTPHGKYWTKDQGQQ